MAPKLEMKLGAEPKKVVFLVALMLVAAYFYFSGSSDGPPQGQQTTKSQPAPKPSTLLRRDEEALITQPKQPTPGKAGPKEFRPSLRPKKGEERSITDVDPTLRTDVLAKLAAVKIERVERSLFDFGSSGEAPKPKQPEPIIAKVIKPKRGTVMLGPEPPPPPPAPQPKPPPPPIPLKFFGNALPLNGGAKRVFCMQGEEVLTPAEGEVIQRRYKIIKVNKTSVVVEDLDYKNQQTLPIDEVQQTG
jgi:hypothetical protein